MFFDKGRKVSTFIEQLVNGLTVGSFYALVALGYSMVYGVMKLINFAHGDLFALGAYLGYSLLTGATGRITASMGLWGGMAFTAFLVALSVALAGVLVERIAYRPVYPSGRLSLVVSALGMAIFIQNAVMAIWGSRPRAFPASVVPSLRFSLFGIPVTLLQVTILGISFALMLAIWLVVEKSSFGAAVRAAALDRETATLLGIDVRKVIFFVFALGPGLGGVAGLMNGLYYRAISFNMGWNYGLKAFTATILGGIGNIPGAMLGGLILGVVESLLAGYVSGAWKDVFVFILLIAILIFRPRGLLGEKTAEKV
ncbi:leucine/isoleucine/valine transporter subunit; membrane component of ABC superfamily [uncultured Spirochaetota bacterium]|jgi:branched-chain amino acid transport system permease protein|nr:leucine/isoleucine/valine transporter subunit; membrane component of ABC superfamily [uncultured Spirochaetota bacterium]